jgi:TPR repeat protein
LLRSLFALLMLSFAAAPATADVATGLEAYRRGDYAAALAAWKPLAETGDPAAQFNLGILYRRGLGVPPDNRQAIGWFERAAVRGHPTAQYNMGLTYEKGIGVPPNRAAALRWYRRAAKTKKPDDSFKPAQARAQYRLATLLLEGDAVNRSAGMFWMQQSGQNGYREAQFQLGLAYSSGEDLPRDSASAARWFERAASQGHAAAQVNLATMYESGTGLTRDDARAAQWYRRAAEQNVAVAQINLGSLFAQGRGVTRDDRAAQKWYKRAAQQDVPEAHYNLGVLYENSPDLADARESYFWYVVAAKSGHRKAGLRMVALREKIGETEAAEIERRAVSWRPVKARNTGKPDRK